MTLFAELNRFYGVTDFGVMADPAATRSRPPALAPDENRRGFQQAADWALAAGMVAGATIFVPPGRYLIGADQDVLRNWLVDIGQRVLVDPDGAESLARARRENPFGASLRVPEGTTLWLAPGAVLVPVRGCIINISSLLICERTECFDLSLGGLVVFGRRVPVLRPEWWGAVNAWKAIQRADWGRVEEEDASPAIQHAIDAAIGSRSIQWPSLVSHPDRAPTPGIDAYSLPPLEIELSGFYFLNSTLNVRADDRRNEILRQLNPTGEESGATINASGLLDTTTVIRGAWSGRLRQGATLIAGESLGEFPLLRLTLAAGLSIKNIVFSTRIIGYQPCVEFWSNSGETNHVSSQSTGLSSCRFEGASTPLVQIGPRVQFGAPRTDGGLPYVRSANFVGSDFSLLTFDGCVFHVYLGGVAVDVRAQQTFPVRFRRCDFGGHAAAMLSLWSGSHYLDGCRFDNRQAPSTVPELPPGTPVRGLELPDNSDIFLRVEYPNVPPGTSVTTPPGYTYLTGFTAIGCVSRSHRFLSTVSPNATEVEQLQDWPVVLINLRQRVVGARLSPSVSWGMQNRVSSNVASNPAERRMNRGGPLVVIGGSFGSETRLLRGALHSAVVGARVHDASGALVTPGYRLDPARYPRQALPATTVFGLRVDQPASIRVFYER